MMSLTVADIQEDVQLMYRITRKVEGWKESHKSPAAIGESIPFSISPAILGLYIQVATEIECSKLPLGPEDAGP